MRKSRFTTEQIIGFIKQAEAGMAVSELGRQHGFSPASQPPDLRRFALITRASRIHASSPCSAAPSIRFLSIGSQFRCALPPHTRSPSCSCASLRSL